jgi:hypothetical protein
VKVEYSLHPLFGTELPVKRSVRRRDVEYYEVRYEGKVVPVARWMTDGFLCSSLRCGFDPHCSLKSLLRLQSLLDSSDLSESSR